MEDRRSPLVVGYLFKSLRNRETQFANLKPIVFKIAFKCLKVYTSFAGRDAVECHSSREFGSFFIKLYTHFILSPAIPFLGLYLKK